MSVPALVSCRDRLGHLKQTVEFLEKHFDDIVLIDCDSKYEPLIEYLRKSPHQVVWAPNVGNYAAWETGIQYVSDFVVNDCDVVADPDCPDDFMDHLKWFAYKYPVTKAGLGLRIDNLPDHYKFREERVSYERRFWVDQIDGPCVAYKAALDTTFAYYRKGAPRGVVGNSIRTGAPYLANHLPWYDDSENLSDDYKFYLSRVKIGGGAGETSRLDREMMFDTQRSQ